MNSAVATASTGAFLCHDVHMPAHDGPPAIGPPAAVFVCACGVRVEVDDPAHVRIVEALHAAGGCDRTEATR